MYWYFYAKVLEKRIIYNSHTIINGIADGIKIKKNIKLIKNLVGNITHQYF